MKRAEAKLVLSLCDNITRDQLIIKPWSDEHVYMMQEIWDVNSEWNWHQWIWGEYYEKKWEGQE